VHLWRFFDSFFIFGMSPGCAVDRASLPALPPDTPWLRIAASRSLAARMPFATAFFSSAVSSGSFCFPPCV